MLREIQRAVDPSPGLLATIQNWHAIQQGLRERRRKRKSQHHRLAAGIAKMGALLS